MDEWINKYGGDKLYDGILFIYWRISDSDTTWINLENML